MSQPIHLADEAATEALGAAFAPVLRASPLLRAAPLVFHLDGELGAGKTGFARGLLRALGFDGRVRSPTYTLLERYVLTGLEVVHLDLYRLVSPDELAPLALAEHLEPGTVLLIEWPQKGGARVPPADVDVQLAIGTGGHTAHVAARSPAGRTLLAAAGVR